MATSQTSGFRDPRGIEGLKGNFRGFAVRDYIQIVLRHAGHFGDLKAPTSKAPLVVRLVKRGSE